MSGLDPIPRHLHPIRARLVLPGDLVVVLRTEELAQIAKLMERVADARSVRIVHRDGSPWVEIDVACGPEIAEPFPPNDLEAYGVHSFALWRYTMAVYVVGPDGAVDDDPMPGLEGSWRA